MVYQYGYSPTPEDEAFEGLPTEEDQEATLLNQHSKPTWLALKGSPGFKKLFMAVALIAAIFSSGVLLGVAIPKQFRTSQSLDVPSHPGPVDGPYGPTVTPLAETLDGTEGTETEGTQCGSNWEEAKAMGCKFDVMASRWYSPECFDEEVLEDMMAEPQINFTWYVDKKHTQTFPSHKAIRGEFDKIYPDNNYHLKHCLYLWRRLHHAVLNNKPIDEDIFAFGHTVHCTRMILEYMEPNFVDTTLSSATSGRPFCRNKPVGRLDA